MASIDSDDAHLEDVSGFKKILPAINPNAFSMGRVEVKIEITSLEDTFINLTSEDPDKGEETLDRELEALLKLENKSKYLKVLNRFTGEDDSYYPSLGGKNIFNKKRFLMAREFENAEQGHLPIVVDLNHNLGDKFEIKDSVRFLCNSDKREKYKGNLQNPSLIKKINRYSETRSELINSVKENTDSKEEFSHPVYAVSPTFHKKTANNELSLMHKSAQTMCFV